MVAVVLIVLILAVLAYFLFVRDNDTESSQGLSPRGAVTRVLQTDEKVVHLDGATGSVKVNVLPSRGALSTQMLPPWSSTIDLAM